uniref:2',5'-phosphodiesterase 12 n=1 Tax=Lygus hesperus TaxID=30085 RepID=A0A146LH84_LYGHE
MLRRFVDFRAKLAQYCKLLTQPTTEMPVNVKERQITMRREPKGEMFEMHFRVFVPQLQLAREFNFKRRANETLETLLARMKTNMEKAFGRKLKKTKNKLAIEKGSPQEEKFVQITADIRKDGKVVPHDLTCEQLFFNKKFEPNNIEFLLCGIPFTIAVNVPYIRSIALPNVAMTDLPVYPLKFVMKFGAKENSKFKWYLSDDNGGWSYIGDGFSYYPKNEEVGKQLKIECTPSNGKVNGDTMSAATVNPIQPSPSPIPYRRRHEYTKSELVYPTFRVVSYNILADRYAETEAANNELFPYCPDYARAWPYRRAMIVDELMGYKADIVCLQEVDTKAFEYDLSVFLKSRFKGVFNKKYTVDEGIATFFNRDRYKLLSNHTCYLGVEVDQNSIFADIWDKIKDNKELSERLRGLGTVAQAIVLADEGYPEKITIVGNTHLFFHPDADHIRLLQGGMFAKFLVQVVEKVRTDKPSSSVSLVICGDLNSVPSCGIYSLFTQGVAPADLQDWKSKEGEHVVGLELRQPFDISSAYGTPKYTNYTAEFKDCLDYVYYQKDKLKVTNVVPLFTEEELQAHTALPSIVCPSDHMALIADLTWIRP